MKHEKYSLKAANFKCIGPEPQGFEEIRRINVIVGRNNSGKSSLLDLIEHAIEDKAPAGSAYAHHGKVAEILTETVVKAEDIDQSFSQQHSDGNLGNYNEFGRRFFVGKMVRTRLRGPNQRDYVGIFDPITMQRVLEVEGEKARPYLTNLCHQAKRNPLNGKVYWKIGAERNIVPEIDQNGSFVIAANGTGATNAIQQFLNKSELDRDIVRVTLLRSLNAIFKPDAEFEEIICRQRPENTWEVFLSEKTKGLIALSQSGSGLKTVILTLCFVHLAPIMISKPLSEFVLAFEELENNLHPALQRRLIAFLAQQAVENQFTLFLTTHSSVAIDLLNRNPESQILHVTHDGASSYCKTVRAYVESKGVLDDLDVRASDLLQSNGIIWVEGPSDRVYLARWIELWSEGKIVEGHHFQCVFYGGRLLSHLSAEDPDSVADAVSILRVNRNACVVIDSDRREPNMQLNATKRRIIDEMASIGATTWVTDGREIENHIPFPVMQTLLEGEVPLKSPPAAFDSVFEYLDKRKSKLGSRYEGKKAVFAEALCALTTRAHLEASPTLGARLELLCRQIRSWNRLPEPAPPDPIRQ
jgi:energy-coupling factor transporter ATP-binding protein EcfA2